jgi:hypothetical protein
MGLAARHCTLVIADGARPHQPRFEQAQVYPGKNETPKSGLGDQGPEWRFCSPIPDTETKPYPRKCRGSAGF